MESMAARRRPPRSSIHTPAASASGSSQNQRKGGRVACEMPEGTAEGSMGAAMANATSRAAQAARYGAAPLASDKANPKRAAAAGASGRIYAGSLLTDAEKKTSTSKSQQSRNKRRGSRRKARRRASPASGVQGSSAASTIGR